MVLSVATLQSQILQLTDQNNSNFVGFPPTVEAAGQNWASAIGAYISELSTPPAVGQAAVAAGQSRAAQAFVDAANSGSNPLDAVLTEYVQQITLLTPTLQPSSITTPPAGNPPIAPALAPFIAVPTSDPIAPAAAIALAIQAYMVTGTYVPPPGTAGPTPWL